jgi:hypothetical protein
MGFVPEQVIFIPIRHRLRVRRAGPCGVRAPGDQIYWDESKESFTDFLALNRAARARALGQGMPLAESSSRLATSWARLGHACARLGPQQLRVGGSKRKAPSRSLPLPSGSFHLPQWDFVACWADSAFPKGDSARHRGDSDPPGATRGADSAHAGPTRSAEWEHGRPLGPSHPGVLDVRGRSDFSRFDPRPKRPQISNFGPPTERRPGGGRRGGSSLRRTHVLLFSRVDAKRPTLAGLVPICARPTC